ncbi:transporter substrate-binding domain-containing protein [Alkalimarinus sediminis]|uniref:Transporter substrate-binding domain-containing protein n=1 Tax=Alkalimarinus sediminis TaxID=1632866 RepID=A0A9E8HK81_9ALTE|nr:transporter substrate-binding domain-containing protein [Alkalimarinus sediminis]UZW74877.1 transporter substrate-binding domain-containing protein [Alkalimarinus sediminis]
MIDKAVKTISLLLLIVHASTAIAKEYRVIGDHYPPYQYKEHNNVKGFSLDVLHAVLGMNGDSIAKFEIYPWKRALHMLKANQANILISANYHKDRELFARYPDEPIITTPWYLWRRKGEDIQPNSLDDLLGKKIGVVQGYSYTEAFWAFIKDNRLYIDAENYSDDINLGRLNQGFYDAAVAELGNGMYLRNSLKLRKIEPITSMIIKEDGLYAIFNKSQISEEAVQVFSENLTQFKKTPEYNKIYKKYFY